MENFPWIWFEVRSNSTMSPSLTLPIETTGQRLTYNLAAVIYLGNNHFTARIQGPSGEWWNYDGMRRFGAAQRDPVQIETDLLHDGCRNASFLIYRRSDD
jgi:hypothetical protein